MQRDFFPLTLDGKKNLKRATNLKMSCINNASEPLKEKNSGPEHNYENLGQHCSAVSFTTIFWLRQDIHLLGHGG